MHIKTYKTHRVREQESLFRLIDDYIPRLQERSIFVVTSKIISLCEGNVVQKEAVVSKKVLIQQEADAYLEHESKIDEAHSIQLTIKNNILIPSAGIDESNGNGIYILYPKNIQGSAEAVWKHLRKRDDIQELGVLITDSHTTPMRRGVVGIGLGWCGFTPLYNYIGKPDCFGALLRFTMKNNVDALAAAAVFCMGEGSEQTPCAVISHAPNIEFQAAPPTEAEFHEMVIPMEEDLYAPLLQNASWVFKNEPQHI